MPVSFSIKNVPDELAEALRLRARQNHRSLQGELMAVLQASVRSGSLTTSQMREPAIAWGTQVLPEHSRRLDTGRRRIVWSESESAVIIRQMRDERDFTVEDLFDYLRTLDFQTPSESTQWIRDARRSR
ncbi:MAG: Arc family DNA-binding protein [Acidobacteria bacterium]|nr:Arc family DNA-binding protein [Acidobacteriota bacterium]